MCFLFRRTHKSQIDGQSVNGSFDGIEYINEQYDSDELQVCQITTNISMLILYVLLRQYSAYGNFVCSSELSRTWK